MNQRHEVERDACGVGFLADLTTRASHSVVAQALEAAATMAHRGARAADGRTGDGAGIMLDTPRELFARDLEAAGMRVESERIAAVGMFLPPAQAPATAVRFAVERRVRSVGVAALRWRTPETPASTARAAVKRIYAALSANASRFATAALRSSSKARAITPASI